MENISSFGVIFVVLFEEELQVLLGFFLDLLDFVCMNNGDYGFYYLYQDDVRYYLNVYFFI